MATEEVPPSSLGGTLGGIAGTVIGGAITKNPKGAAMGGKIGTIAGTTLEPYISGPQIAQRREFKKAKERLRTGMGYGSSGATKQQERTDASQQMAAQIAAQQAGLSRAQAGGMMSGAQATQAAGLQAGATAAGAAQTERDIQARSQALAQQQHAEDQARVDMQVALAEKRSATQGKEIKEAKKGLFPQAEMYDSAFSSRLSKVAAGGTGAGLPE